MPILNSPSVVGESSSRGSFLSDATTRAIIVPQEKLGSVVEKTPRVGNTVIDVKPGSRITGLTVGVNDTDTCSMSSLTFAAFISRTQDAPRTFRIASDKAAQTEESNEEDMSVPKEIEQKMHGDGEEVEDERPADYPPPTTGLLEEPASSDTAAGSFFILCGHQSEE